MFQLHQTFSWHFFFSLSIPPLLKVLILVLASPVRRGSRPYWPVTILLPSSASYNVSCWSMADGPTCACAVSSATSSTRTLPSPWCTSGLASSVASLLRSEENIRSSRQDLRRSFFTFFDSCVCLGSFCCRRCMISTSSHSTTLCILRSLCWPWGYLTRSFQFCSFFSFLFPFLLSASIQRILLKQIRYVFQNHLHFSHSCTFLVVSNVILTPCE